MFGIVDFISLVFSVFIILPIVSIIRELGYLFTSKILGAKEAKITIGSGPNLFKFSIFEIRKYYFIYSWCSYDELRKDTKWAHILLYASPMLANLITAFVINALLANGLLEMETFWSRFIFYALYFVLFDAIPLYYPDGQPSNGRVIYDLLRYGKRSDFERGDPQMAASTDEFRDEEKDEDDEDKENKEGQTKKEEKE
ncbi:hypothetical protein ACFOGI_15520 [Virgibacillus xinjiangensis]|uniref:Uncharacterized protein n=1 Tax=Virgibacillus xinjiangensis TaxID=393090 RepID=A0ABV7CZH8_9BACI